MNCYPTGSNLPPPMSLERIIKRSGLDIHGKPYAKVYLVQNGDNQKQWITTEKVATQLGIDLNANIELISGEELNAFETGPDITTIYPEGTLIKVKGDPKIYILSNGEARHITSEIAFKKLGHSAVDDDKDGLWDSVIEISNMDGICSGAHTINDTDLNKCGGPGNCVVNQTWPKGGETVYGGTARETTYTVNNPANCSNVCVSYSIDRNATSNTITCNAPLHSEFTWMIPEIPSTGATIKVTAYDKSGRPYSASPESFLTVVANPTPGQDYFDVFNDGGVGLAINSISVQYQNAGDPPWLIMNNGQALPPQANTMTIAPNSSLRIPVKVNKTGVPVGNHVATIRLSSNDPAAPEKTIEVNLQVKGENDAPAAPVNLHLTPSGWAQGATYLIDWTNPADASGIIGGYYKLGFPPTGNLDGTYFTIDKKPLTINSFTDGSTRAYVWLEDSEHNIDFNNHASVEMQHDATPPSIEQLFPANGVTNIPADASISFLAKDFSAGIDSDTIVLRVNGEQVTPQKVTSISDGYWIEYHPASRFAFDQQVTVNLRVYDRAIPANFFETSYTFQTFSAGDDFDNDGLSNSLEYQHGTNPTLTDSDSDGLGDGWEIGNGLDPNSDQENNGADGDSNDNGLSNLQEYLDGLYYSAGNASLTGFPAGLTCSSALTATVGGDGVLAYQYRIDGQKWQPVRPITDKIQIDGLVDGSHTLEVIGQDANGYWQGATAATTRQWTIDSSLDCKGDINGDKIVNLSDLILSLQITSGLTPNEKIFLSSDVNGDEKIGVEDAISILCIISGTCEDNNPVQDVYLLQPGPPEGKDTYYGTSYFPEGHPDEGEMRYGGWGDAYYDYLQFDISSLPAADRVASAKIWLYSNITAANDPQVDVEIISNNWAEAGVTMDANPPSTFYKRMDRVVAGWNSIDVTSLYKDWKEARLPNYGIKLSPTFTNQSNGSFYSSDYLDDPAKRPKLVIEPVD